VNAIETRSLSKRYGRTWALDGCTLAIPAERVVALVGPNGAGKTTLLHLAVGLTSPTGGTITVLGGAVPGSNAALERIGFVAQDTPLYKNLSIADTLRLVASLSATWDEANARAHLTRLEIPLERKVGHLSGGQQAQVSLAVALGRHPELLVLDEPVARLDPLARHDFMAVLMAAVAEEGISVLFSSHVVAELERVCDYLVVLNHGKVQVAGDVDDLLGSHQVFTGPTAEAATVGASLAVVQAQQGDRQTSLLVRTSQELVPPAGWAVGPTNLEELVLAYLRSRSATALPGPRPSSDADARATA
jgi:ABC-2 type transport system ATP-binding protein